MERLPTPQISDNYPVKITYDQAQKSFGYPNTYDEKIVEAITGCRHHFRIDPSSLIRAFDDRDQMNRPKGSPFPTPNNKSDDDFEGQMMSTPRANESLIPRKLPE